MTVFEKYRLLEEKIKGEKSLKSYSSTWTEEGNLSSKEKEETLRELQQHEENIDQLYRQEIPFTTNILRASTMTLHDAKFALPAFLKNQLGEDYHFAIHRIDGKNYYVLQKEDYVIDDLFDLWEIQVEDREGIVLLHRTEDGQIKNEWESFYVQPFVPDLDIVEDNTPVSSLKSKIEEYNPNSAVRDVLGNFMRAYIETKYEDKSLTMEKFIWISEYALTSEEEARELEAEEYFAKEKGKMSSRRKKEYYARRRRAEINQIKALGKVGKSAKSTKCEDAAHLKDIIIGKAQKVIDEAEQIEAASYRKVKKLESE